MRTHEWFRTNSFTYREFGNARQLGRVKRERGLTVSLILPTRNVAETIGSVLDEVDYLRRPDIRLIDQVIVVDADSTDGTAEIALHHDVEVYSENALMPEYGRAHGKGDAMWRGLSVATGDIIAFADTDTGNFCRQLVTGVVGCLITKPDIQFVKAAYRRPYTQETVSVPDGGGRVTELTAKPALNLLFPELAGFVQRVRRRGRHAHRRPAGLRPAGDGAGRRRDAQEQAPGPVQPQPDGLLGAEGRADQGHAGPLAGRSRSVRVRLER